LAAVVRRGGYELLGISAVTPLIVDAWNMAHEGKRLGLTTAHLEKVASQTLQWASELSQALAA
jgi:glycosyltransferase A (GT-A) superfamily protein (DUF2064 family)